MSNPVAGKKPPVPLSKRHNLTLPLALEQGSAPKLFIHTLYLLGGFIAAGIVWASVAKIKELTIAGGELVPVGSVQLVQHLEGGIIAEILVTDGQIVEKNTALVRLQPAGAASDFGQVNIRVVNLALQQERLQAMIEGRDTNFGQYGIDHPKLAANQRRLMTSQRSKSEEERRTLNAKVDRHQYEITAFHGQDASLKKQIELQKEQVTIRESLLRQGYVSRTVYLDVRRTLEKTRAERIANTGRLFSAKEEMAEAKSLLKEYDANLAQTHNDDFAKVSAELAELELAIVKHEDRVSRLVIYAPVKGIIQELVPKAIGEVIKPGDVVARIVPMDRELVAEIRLLPKDIGHITIGNPADIKITTFDPARFGGISGTVRKISATTFQNEKGEPYYKAQIGLARNFVGLGAEHHLVLPGMVVNAEIITGSKSLMHYLLKPVYRSLDIAFSER